MATARWHNADGLEVPYGGYYRDPTNFVNKGWELSTLGGIKQIEMDFDLSAVPAGTTYFTTDLNNDGTNDGFNDGDPRFPANASVLRVTMIMTTAAVGGTSFTLGTYQITGAALGATSLITATEGVIANVNAIGKRVFGNGSLVQTAAGTAGVGASNAYIGLSTVGAFTAGKGKILIEYIDIGANEVVAP